MSNNNLTRGKLGLRKVSRKSLGLKLSVSSLTISSLMLAGGWAVALTDEELRQVAPAALSVDDVPDMQHILDTYIRDYDYALALGKALFWDTQVGGDGMTACASCHFHAGADSRSKNQLNPGIDRLTNGDDDFDPKISALDAEGEPVLDPNEPGNPEAEIPLTEPSGPNYQLKVANFPLLREDNDVVSSHGVFLREYTAYQPGAADECQSQSDNTYNIDGINTRRVEPRNTPTVINAVFNHRNFWDGRANNLFNGENPLGKRGQLNGEGIWVQLGGRRSPATKVQIAEPNSSLASQAVGPPGSIFEMSCGDNRAFALIGKRLSRERPLETQAIHAQDSVFGVGPKGNLIHRSGVGLKYTYAQLIQRAFKREYWGARGYVDGTFRHMEANFSLYFGLAVQLYEATLVSDDTPFDQFMRGNNTAMTPEQKEGLEVFLDLGRGACIVCHAGPEFTIASVRAIIDGEPEGAVLVDGVIVPPVAGEVGAAVPAATERMLMFDGLPSVYDIGFYNLGVRASETDLGLGEEINGFPLSFSEQGASGDIIDDEAALLPTVEPVEVGEPLPEGPIQLGERTDVNGAFKTPGLRNVAMTAPYFHNGGHATLDEVIRFYRDNGVEFFANENLPDTSPDLFAINIENGGEEGLLVEFLGALTDERVALEKAPFDHPAICVTNGHPEPIEANVAGGRPDEATDDLLCLEAVGQNGITTPRDSFLGIQQIPPEEPEPL